MDVILGHANRVDWLISNAYDLAGLLQSVHPNQVIVDSATNCSLAAGAFASRIALDPDLYDALVVLNESVYHNITTVASGHAYRRDGDVAQDVLDALDARYLYAQLEGFASAGVNLDQATRSTLQQMDSTLQMLSAEFSQNIAHSTSVITVPPSELGILEGLDPGMLTCFVAFEITRTKYHCAVHTFETACVIVVSVLLSKFAYTANVNSVSSVAIKITSRFSHAISFFSFWCNRLHHSLTMWAECTACVSVRDMKASVNVCVCAFECESVHVYQCVHGVVVVQCLVSLRCDRFHQ